MIPLTRMLTTPTQLFKVRVETFGCLVFATMCEEASSSELVSQSASE